MSLFMDYQSSASTNLPAMQGHVGDMGSVTGLGRFPEVENGNSFQFSCLKIPMNRGAYWATVRGLQRVRTQHTTIIISDL